MRHLGCLVLGLLAPIASASAQVDLDLDALRRSAETRGWHVEHVGEGRDHEERWCAQRDAPCPGLRVVDGPAHLVISDRVIHARESIPGGFMEASIDRGLGTFSFAFTVGERSVICGWETSFEVEGVGVLMAPREEMTDATTLARERARYLDSAASLRATALQRRRTLRDHVARVAHMLTVCDAPNDPGRFVHREVSPGAVGMFDTCPHRQLRPDERTALIARMAAHHRAEEALIRRHAVAWHAALRTSLGLPSGI